MGILFILIHGIVCVTVFLLMRTGRLKSQSAVLTAVIFVPVCGLVILYIEECRERKLLNISRQLGLESFKISDVRYKRIAVDDDSDKDITVPLEEAISVNDASIRRRLMMDILHRNPEEYIELLQMTRTADDTELTHYATTTMMEIQNRYEAEIHDISKEYRDNPGDVGSLKRYRRLLQKYIDSGLISGRILEIYRRQLDSVLRELCRKAPDNSRYYKDYIRNRLALGSTEGLEKELIEMLDRWQDDESVYQIYVEYLWDKGRGSEIPRVLQQLKDRAVYISGNGRAWLKFWEKREL